MVNASPPQPSALSQPAFAPGWPAFLEPGELIERSQPTAQNEWFWAVGGTLMVLVLVASWAGSQTPELRPAVNALTGMMLIGAALGMGLYTWRVAQSRNEEMRRLEYVEELLQLRRWPEAAVVLQRMLSEPMRTPQARIQALVYLASVLGRYQRYQDAVTVQEYLLAHVAMDDSASHALRCARAMGMLHEDRLVDADRAINELRRSGAAPSSAGLALVELYRDVKTGHPAEAIQTFRDRLPQMRKQLGHRVGEAWALAARAYDMVGQTQLAAEAYASASALAPIADISTRYAEVAALTGRYPAMVAPAE